ncbi:hypothetical protein VTH82DRAFT_5346 [Thermothelomyces myriococcoides]
MGETAPGGQPRSPPSTRG